MPDYVRGPTDPDPERTRPVDPIGPVEPPERQVIEERRLVERHAYEEPGYRDSVALRRTLYARIAYVVWTIVAFIEAFIGLRVFLKLIAANPGNAFVNFVYDISGVFVNPFLGIVNDLQSGNSILEINSLIAMLIYLLLGYAVLRIIWLLLRVTAPIHE